MFLRVVSIALLVMPLIARAQMSGEPINLLGEIEANRLTTGDWAGGYKLNRFAGGMNYYFTSQGLLAIASESAFSEEIEGFLDLYLKKSDPQHGWIDDVQDLQAGKLKLSDSDDSYISLLLLLIGEYYQTSQGKAWWKKPLANGKPVKNGERVKQIAEQILLDNPSPDGHGLISVFSQARPFTDPNYYPGLDADQRTFSEALQKSAYLMDSCEVWAGLHALSGMLAAEGDGDEIKFNLAAQRVAEGISGLFNEKAHAFYILDTEKAANPDFYPSDMVKFYPHRVAQAFPELYHVPLGDAATTESRYNAAWKYLNADGTDWATGFPKDGSSAFPLMFLGYTAALRANDADTRLARKQLHWFETVLNEQPDNSNFRYLQEVGYALRIRQKLAGDINLDGKVDLSDVMRYFKFYLGLSQPTSEELISGDVRPRPGTKGRFYGDGKISGEDLNWLYRRSVGLETIP